MRPYLEYFGEILIIWLMSISVAIGILLVLNGCGKPSDPPVPPPADPKLSFQVVGKGGVEINGLLNAKAQYTAEYAQKQYEKALAFLDAS